MGLYPYVHLPVMAKVIMQGKLFQWCTQILYCYLLSLGGNVIARRISSLSWDPSYQNYQNLMLFTSSDTK